MYAEKAKSKRTSLALQLKAHFLECSSNPFFLFGGTWLCHDREVV